MRISFVSIAAFIVGALFPAMVLANNTSAADSPQIAPPDSWVNVVSIPKPDRNKLDAPLQTLVTDRQDYFGPASTDSYLETAALLQTAEGLSAGYLAIPWHPDTSDLIVHHVTIIRGGEQIDVLDKQPFTVLQREPNLEWAMLDGVKTAVLQPEGLRVGDILNAAWTVKQANPVFQNHANQIIPNITNAPANELRLRQIWSDERDMRWQVSEDLPQPKIKKTRDGTELTLTMKNVEPPVLPQGAPLRFALNASIETTDFKSWSEISTLFAPIFDEAAALPAESSLFAEAERIAATTDNKTERAEMALKLVQDKIRYVFAGIESGGYVPISAEETWQRRFGDCKAKTAVLIALLHELDIEAEPALVSSVLGDELINRLPVIGLFDHVVVHAKIDGEEYWLDGTRIGDVSLEQLPAPVFSWALPLRHEGVDLTRVVRKAPIEPNSFVEIEIDASKSLTESTPITSKIVMRGNNAILVRSNFNNLTKEKKAEQLDEIWNSIGSVEVKKSDMVFDDQTGTLLFSMSGVFDLSWSLAEGSFRYLIPNAAIGWDVNSFNDGDDERTAPWALPFPSFERAITVIKLPKDSDNFQLDEDGISFEFAGIELARTATIENGELVMERTTRITESEISAANAKKLTKLLSDMETGELAFISQPSGPITRREREALGDLKLTTAVDYIERGLAFLDRSQHEDAYQDFNEAIELEPESSWGYANRGIASFNLRNFGSARRDFEKSISIESDNWVALHGMGLVLGNEGELQSALSYFNRSIEIKPDNTFAIYNRAIAFAQMARYEDALTDVNLAIDQNPDAHGYFFLKAQIFSATSDFSSAIDAITRALSLASANVEYLRFRSAVYEENGDNDLALADLDHVLELSPDSATNYNNRCWFRATHNLELEKALADCNRAVQIEPSSAPSLDSRGFVQLRRGKFKEAIADYDRALAVSPTQTASLFGRGIARLRSGDLQGQADLDAAIQLTPDIAKQFEGYGVVLD